MNSFHFLTFLRFLFDKNLKTSLKKSFNIETKKCKIHLIFLIYHTIFSVILNIFLPNKTNVLFCLLNGKKLKKKCIQKNKKKKTRFLITVMIGFEGSFLWHAQIVGLHGGQLGQLDVQMVQVRGGYFLVEFLGQNVDTERVGALFGEQLDLGQHLVGERVAHHKTGMTVSAAQVDQATLG